MTVTARVVLHVVVVFCTPALLVAQGSPPPAVSNAPTVSASLRTRVEHWNWFGTEDTGEYAFVGSLLRVGVAQQRSLLGWRVEAAAPVIVGLPDDAVAPAPRGQLGLGAAYDAANDSTRSPVGFFVKQAFVRFGPASREGRHSLRLGRFEFVDGAETTPTPFGSLELRGVRASVRTDVRRLRLSERRDLWYSQSGAFEPESFGYAGRPSGGQRTLATVADLGAEYRPNPHFTVGAYGALARGASVVESIYPSGRTARLLLPEAEVRR